MRSERFTGASLAGAAVCLLLMLGTGGYIYYNTHILNPYRTTFQVDDARAQYEKKYKQYWGMPQPRITDVTTNVDFYPDKRSVDMHGTLWLENKTSSSIDQVAITLWPMDLIPLPKQHLQVKQLSFAGGQTPVIEDPELGFYLFKLPAPLAPHARIQLDYSLQYDNPGFENSQPNTDIIHNGSFLNDRYGPYIGYAQEIELTDDSTRHRHGSRRPGECQSSTMSRRGNTTASASTPTGSTSTQR